jgi:hypothetical protein
MLSLFSLFKSLVVMKFNNKLWKSDRLKIIFNEPAILSFYLFRESRIYETFYAYKNAKTNKHAINEIKIVL